MTLQEARRIRNEGARTSYVHRLAQMALVVGGFYVLYTISAWVAPVLAPVLLSLLIAYFLDPLVDKFEARRVNRTLAIVFIATIALATAVGVAAIVIPVVAVEIEAALRQLPAWVADQYAALRAFASERLGVDLQQQLTGGSTIEAVTTRVQRAVSTLAASAVDSVASILNLILIPVFTFYFLRDFDSLKLKPLVLVPPRYQDEFVASAREMDDVVGAWLRGQIQVALLLAVLYAVGLGIIGIKLGVFIGIIAGLLNVVPYFGVAIGIALSTLMTLIYGEPAQLIWVGLLFVLAQLLDDYVIKPRLVGEKVGMSPVMVMVVLLLGGSLFGFFGLLLSIPVVAAGSVLAQKFLERYRESEFYTRETDEERQGGSGPADYESEAAEDGGLDASDGTLSDVDDAQAAGGDSDTSEGGAEDGEDESVDDGSR